MIIKSKLQFFILCIFLGVMSLLNSNASAATPISCGQAVTGSISGVGAKNEYTLAISAGDQVTIRATKTGRDYYFNPFLELYAPDGSLVTKAAGQIDKTLTVAGTYMLIVRDDDTAQKGSYTLMWQKIKNTCSTTALTCGQSVVGSIGRDATTPPWKFYTLNIAANDQISIRATNTSGDYGYNTYLELYAPDGSLVTKAAGQIDKTLTVAGTYMLIVRDDDTAQKGSYMLFWQRWNNLCNTSALTCGQTLSGSITSLGEQDFYSFKASAGDAIVLTMTNKSGGIDPSLELYDSSGLKIAGNYSSSGGSATITQTLSAGGNYLIIASDYGNNETGSYSLKLQKNTNSCPEVLVTAPNGGGIIEAGSTILITWTSTSTTGISSQEIRLSTDGGTTFPTVVATGLAGSVHSYPWPISSTLKTVQGRIRITVTDTSGASVHDDSDDDFIILQSVLKVSRTYAYDQLNRLTQITNEDGTKITYTYDAVGNRLALNGGGGGTYSISGSVKTASGVAVSGVTMTLSGGTSKTATTDSYGNYKFTGVYNGSYTITPSKTGYTFTPKSKNVTVSGANVTGQNFTRN